MHARARVHRMSVNAPGAPRMSVNGRVVRRMLVNARVAGDQERRGDPVVVAVEAVAVVVGAAVAGADVTVDGETLNIRPRNTARRCAGHRVRP